MLHHYIKIAIRNITRYKLQNTISIIGLSVSLLCFSLCLYCSRFMQSIDSCFPKYKQIAEIQFYLNDRLFSGTTAPFADALKNIQYPEIETICRTAFSRDRSFNVYVKEEQSLPYTFQTMEVDSTYADLFTPTILFGSWQQAAASANSIVMTETTARNVFRNPSEAIGKQLELNKRLATSPKSTPETGGIYYTVRAVIKDLPTNTSMHLMKNINLLALNDSEGLFMFEENHAMTGCKTYALLKADKRPIDLNRQLIRKKQTFPIFKKEADIRCIPIGKGKDTQQVANMLSWITGVIGILILLTGLLNFFYFMVGQYMNRTHEYSIRKVNGCSRFQLFAQLFVQSTLLVFATAILTGCLLEQIASGLQINLFKFNLEFDTQLLLLHTGEYILFILLACLFVCLLTVFRIQKISIHKGIQGGVLRPGRHALRNLMLGLQFFICWLFVSLAFALYLQTETTTKTIFSTLSLQEKESIFSFTLDYPFMKTEEKQALITRIRQQAGVKDILLTGQSYTQDNTQTIVQTEKDTPDKAIEVQVLRIPSNFFSFMQIPLQSGHTYNSPDEMLVDEVFMQKHKEISIGSTLYNYNDAYRLCGISTSFHTDLYYTNNGTIFLPDQLEKKIGHCYIKAHPGQEKQIRKQILTILREALPSNIQPNIQTLKEDIYDKQALEAKMKNIILFFTIVCLVITLLGTYSAITLDTEHRQKEVAIRKVNGATSINIIRLFAMLYIKLLLCSALLALPIILSLLRTWKQMYTVFFEPGLTYWGSISLTIVLLALATVFFRIKKAADQNPAETIKTE